MQDIDALVRLYSISWVVTSTNLTQFTQFQMGMLLNASLESKQIIGMSEGERKRACAFEEITRHIGRNDKEAIDCLGACAGGGGGDGGGGIAEYFNCECVSECMHACVQ